MKVNVRISGALREHVEKTTSSGDYENVSEYVRDLIRQDIATREAATFLALKAELQSAFAAPRGDYDTTSADDIRAAAAPRLRK